MPVISKALELSFIQSGISLPSLPGHRTSLHFGCYLFPVRLREEAELAWLAWWNTEVVYLPKDGHPSPRRWVIELATTESQVRHTNQKTKPLLYRKHCSSQFTVQLRSLVTNWEIGKKLLKYYTINASATILVKTLFSSVYSVIIYRG